MASDERPDTLKKYDMLSALPLGKWMFSKLVCLTAPYFGSVKPLVRELRPGYCEIFLKKRRCVQNHIGTVHVIAICNLLEMAMGIMAQASIPAHRRWIPKGMEVEYPAKADTDLIGYAEVDQKAWVEQSDVPVRVYAKRADGTVVVQGTIHLWVTDKKKS